MNYKCEFCTDLRNLQPAKYISGDDEKFLEWIAKARKKIEKIYMDYKR